MSLICAELETAIPGTQEVYYVLHASGPGYAVGEKPMRKISRFKRRTRKYLKSENGFNVFSTYGTIGWSGNWQWSTLEKGEFLFSVSENVMKTHLPRAWKRIIEEISPKAKSKAAKVAK